MDEETLNAMKWHLRILTENLSHKVCKHQMESKYQAKQSFNKMVLTNLFLFLLYKYDGDDGDKK